MRKWLFCFVIVAIAALWSCPSLNGQDIDREEKEEKKEKKEKKTPVVELKEVVVTATRTEKKPEDVTASVTVITGDEIERRNVETVSELLRDVPGVFVRQAGPTGSITSVLLRGTHPTQTLVLIDGIEMNDPNLGGAFDLSDLDTACIERIEVVRGSQSALYGSSAVGGVINIVTKKGRGEPTLFGEAWGGSFDLTRVQAGGSGASEKSYGSFSAVHLSTENDILRNRHERQGFFGKFGTALGEDIQLEVLTRIMQSEQESPYDYTNPLTLDENISRNRDTTVVGAKFTHRVNETVSYHLKGSFFDVDNFFQNKGDNIGDPDEFTSAAEATVLTLNGQVKLDLGSVIAEERVKDELIAGAEFKDIDSLNSTESPFGPGGFEDETDVKAIYLQNEFRCFSLLSPLFDMDRPDVVTVIAGGRADKYGALDVNYLPRIGLSYKFPLTDTDVLTVKGNYGKGFRAPSPIEFFDPFCGNLDLKPEKSVSYDSGVELSILDKRLKLGVTYFQIDVKDLIAWSPTSWKLENISNAEIEGVEFAFKGEITKELKLGLTYTYQDPRDLSDNSELPFRSPHFGGFEITYKREKFALALTGYFSEAIPAEDVLDENGQPQPDAGKLKLVNLSAAYELSKSAEILLKVTNLLNEKYKESQREPYALPLAVFLGLRMGF